MRFYKTEIDKEEIETFVRDGFEKKLGKESVLGTQFLSWPNEFAIIVEVHQKTTETSEISHQLQKTLLDHGLAAMVIVQEAEP